VQIVLDNETDLLAVVDGEGRYMGAVDLSGLLRSMSRLLRFHEEGALIEIDVPPRDYALARLAHTIEESGARVLSINSEVPKEAEGDVRLMVKVNVADPVRTRAVLEHYGYQVVAVDRARISSEDLEHRVREFIHYLDV
jgi:phage gp46-like protein